MTLSRRLFIATLPLLAARRARAASFTMQLTTTATGDIDVKWLDSFKAAVEAGSHGEIRANVYPGSQLGSGQTTIEGVALGTIEVAANASGLFEALEPRFAFLAVPGLVDSMAQGMKLLTHPAVRARLDQIGRDKGVQVLSVLPATPASIVSRRPIRSLADLAGMKVRVPGSALLITQLKALGASPIAMSLGEVLPAFQNGTIDGVYAGPTIFSPLKYYDIAKSMTVLPRTFIAMVSIVNSGFMSNLGPLEPIAQQAAHQADTVTVPWAEGDVDAAQAIWTSHGGQILSLPPEDAKRYLEVAVPAALKALSPAAREDYEFIKAAGVAG